MHPLMKFDAIEANRSQDMSLSSKMLVVFILAKLDHSDLVLCEVTGNGRMQALL